MNKIFFIALLATLVATVLGDDTTPLSQVANSSMEVVDDLYSNMVRSYTQDLIYSDNFVFCPVTATIAMGMTALGARRDTYSQIQTAMKLPERRYIIESGVQDLIIELNRPRNATIKMANKMFIARDINLKSHYAIKMTSKFGSSFEKMDFSNSVKSAEKINHWIRQTTDNHILDLVKPEDLTDVRMLLINAIYFKLNWPVPFESTRNVMRPFYFNDTKMTEVPMVSRTGTFVHGDIPGADATFILLPFKSDDTHEEIEMMVTMPNNKGDIGEMETKFSDVDWPSVHRNAQRGLVTLTMPKFRISTKMDLESPMKRMGMTDMFDDENANFSRMTSSQRMKVSKVLQNVVFEINENESHGSTASGDEATDTPTEYTIDRPISFIVSLENDQLYTVILAGSVTVPESESNELYLKETF